MDYVDVDAALVEGVDERRGHGVENCAFGGSAAVEENSGGFQAGGEVVVADPGKIVEGDREQGSVRDFVGDFDAGARRWKSDTEYSENRPSSANLSAAPCKPSRLTSAPTRKPTAEAICAEVNRCEPVIRTESRCADGAGGALGSGAKPWKRATRRAGRETAGKSS